ncbi:LHFPL tetraspan subfamily member 3 protein-like [Uloborus diversus]|uniref:LHFPL tetraspan subfamily member 3 protein-like n=1 Tax=Uloborus diversus TaxID=327109 RepID=UPI00240A6ECF|nr:LHFPL tetraspan subfamily member 3 protein-like [Uloborus diversus]
MESKCDYASETNGYHASYLRNSKAVGVMWGVFTLCFAVIICVAFVHPHWIGDTPSSERAGYFGPWRACRQEISNEEMACQGQLDDFFSIPSPAFRVSTVFTALALVAVGLCIVCMLLFFVCQSSTVFHLCGWMQVFSGGCLAVGVASFPAGWDSEVVRAVCGPEADDFDIGRCGVRWAYMLAAVGVIDAVILAALAFLLATKRVKIAPGTASIYKGEVNSAFLGDTQSLASRKSLAQPVLLLPQPLDPERVSEFSQRTGRSHKGSSHYGASIHNFQL